MPRFKDEAICLRHFEWSQTSQIVGLLTLNHGIIRGVAKGAKRQSPSSIARFSGGFELFNSGQILVNSRSTHELATFTEWDLQNDFYYLRKDFIAQNLAMYSADITLAMLGEHASHPNIYYALFELLDNLQVKDAQQKTLLIFQWRLLLDSGFKPHLQEDVHLRGALDISKNLCFDPNLGGLTRRSSAASWRVSKDTVNLLIELERLISKAEQYTEKEKKSVMDSTTFCKFKPDTFVRANKLLCTYIRAILDRNLPTMEAVLSK